jgi:pyruvate formate lyase activating enzyme
MYDQRLCKNFNDCVKKGKPDISVNNGSIEINRSGIKNLEKLKDVCVSKAMTVVGMELDASEIMDEIEKDLPFYQKSGGGVTFSGGEPLSQNGPLTQLMNQIKKKRIHISIETSLHVTWNQIERCLGIVDCFLVDLKHVDEEKFMQYTDGDLHLVLDNLQKLDDRNENIIVRIPVIPGFNHSKKEMIQIIDYAKSLKSAREIHFIPYHTLGTEKYRMLGMAYPYHELKSVSESEITPYLEYAKTKGLKTKIGG